MANGVDVQLVLAALAKKLGDLTLEAEIAKIELQQAHEENASLQNAISGLKRALRGSQQNEEGVDNGEL